MISEKERYLKRKEKVLAQKKEYYLKNKECLRIKSNLYYCQNKEIIKERRKKYSFDKLGWNAAQNRYKTKRRKIDISYRIKENLRNRVRAALHGLNKSAKTLELLSCSIEELKLHLQSKFSIGMHWNNYGTKGWEIDHIIPCSLFDLTKEAEQQKCFCYTNLQPLWKVDNIKKSNTI